jgi:uracil-DNA glycosylase family 4
MPRKPDPVRNQLRILKSMGFGVLEGVETSSVETEGLPASSSRTPDKLDPPAPKSILEGESLPLSARVEVIDGIAAEIAACRACRLCDGRTNVVPGEGNLMAELAFVIEAMKFKREEVWIGNIVKCRPPGNRPPEPDEMEACLPYLERQLAVVRPKVIVALGKTALTGLLPEHAKAPMGRMRGQWLEWHGIPLMPTFHPAYLLRSPTQKRLVWEDMKLVMKEFGKTP